MEHYICLLVASKVKMFWNRKINSFQNHATKDCIYPTRSGALRQYNSGQAYKTWSNMPKRYDRENTSDPSLGLAPKEALENNTCGLFYL